MKWHSPQPQGSSLGTGLCCPGPSSLTRPHPPHSRAHRDFTAWRLIRDAFAVRERRGDPRVVPSFRCAFLPDMPSSASPGSSTSHCPISRRRHGLRHRLTGSTLPILPQSARALNFGAYWFTIATACQFARLPLSDQTRIAPSAPEAFTSRLSARSVTLPAAGYDYDIDWTPMSAGLAPAGIATSFAALERIPVRLTHIRRERNNWHIPEY
jgi:hypothetical protein